MQLSLPLSLCFLEHWVTNLAIPLPAPPTGHPFEASVLLPDTARFPLSVDAAVCMGSGMLLSTVGVKDLVVIPPRPQCGPDLELTGRKLESASIWSCDP